MRVCVAVWAVAAALCAAAADGVPDLERWRAERVAKLTAPDGWLTLVGLHFLNEGPNTIGSAAGSEIVLPKGPSRVGTVTLQADNSVVFDPAPGVEVRVDGRTVAATPLKLAQATTEPSVVTFGTLRFFVIERGGKKALRVRDSAAERRIRFAGLEYFPDDPSWRIEARWVALERARLMPITNSLGQTYPAPVPGKAVFERDGRTCELLAIDEGPGRPLLFVFADETSGKETYGAARFVYASPSADGRIVLDFNRAENPPCAFTSFATCPLPPPGNRLPFAVTAGEKTYRGPAD